MGDSDEPTPADDYEFTLGAWDDLVEITDRFDERRLGLGSEVGYHIFALIERHVLPSPRTPVRHPREPAIHILRDRRYKLRVFYMMQDNVVMVLALEHMRELPDKWRSRLLMPDDD